MMRISTLALAFAWLVWAGPAGATTLALQYDPYTGTTVEGESEEDAETSTYEATATPQGESQPASPLGLTPGFWQQEQHFYAWTDYTQTDSFETVFGVTATGSPTLLDALADGGGGEDALGRHAVAALLNATNPYVNYPFTREEIILKVQQAYDTGDFESTKDLFEEANEAGGELPKY